MCTEQTEHVCMQSAWYGTVHGVVQLHICKQFSAQQKMHFWDKYCEMQWIKRICNLFSFLFIGSSLFPFSSSRPFSYAPKSYALFKNWIYMFVFNPTPSHGNGLLYANKANEKKTNREGHKNKTIWQSEKAKEERKKKSERKTKLEHVFRTRRIMHSVCKRHKYFRMLPNWMDSDNRNYFNSFRFIRSIFGRLFCYIFVVKIQSNKTKCEANRNIDMHPCKIYFNWFLKAYWSYNFKIFYVLLFFSAVHRDVVHGILARKHDKMLIVCKW